MRFYYLFSLILVLVVLCELLRKSSEREGFESSEKEREGFESSEKERENFESSKKERENFEMPDLGGKEESSEEKKLDYLSAVCEMTPGSEVVQGPPGPAGQPGPPGGSFTERGSLISLSNPDKRLDRFFGSGVNAFLADPNMRSHQLWTLRSDGQLENRFGGCLKMDGKTGEVFVSSCVEDNPSPDQMWEYDTYGRIQSKENRNVCLEVSAETKAVKTGGGKLSETLSASNENLEDGTAVLTTGDCNMTKEQAWYFL